MKIFISYKQSWLSDKELQDKLWKLRAYLENLWHSTYIYYFDTDFSNQTPKEIITNAKLEIEKSDLVLAFVNYEHRSEWMMNELWIAFWLNKPVKVLMNQKLEEEYYLTYWISTDTYVFSDFSEIKKILSDNTFLWK
jgi:nucleoside 2-deoxyribosyltransferase